MSGLSFEEMNNWRVNVTNEFSDKTSTPVHTINPVNFYN